MTPETGLILPAGGEVGLLDSLDQLGDLEAIRKQLRGSVDNAGAMQYIKVHQANSAFPGLITRGVDMVRIMEEDRWLTDYRYEVGWLWRDGSDVVHQQYVPWYHPGVENPPPGGHRGKPKRAYRVFLLGMTEPHVGIPCEFGGDSNGVMQFVNAIKLNLDQHLGTVDEAGQNVGLETPYPVLTMKTDSYPSKYAKDTKIYKATPTFVDWLSEKAVEGMGGAASVQALKVVEAAESSEDNSDPSAGQGEAKVVQGAREDTPHATARPRRRSLA